MLAVLVTTLSTLLPVSAIQDGTFRLVGGSSINEGRVEVYYNREWGSVCDDSWALDDASMVCRTLGYRHACAAHHNARFGQGSWQSPIHLDNMNCPPGASTLSACTHNGWGQHNCGHNEDASAVCCNVDLTCGVAPLYVSSNQQFIVNGNNADANRYPWQAFVYNQARTENNFCGGTIIASNWLLTNAHCIDALDVAYPSRIIVVGGAHILRVSGGDQGRQQGSAAEVIVHENFNPNGGGAPDNNLALIKLNGHFTWSDQVRPICLPDAEAPSSELSCIITGWGVTADDSGLASVLQMGKVPMLSRSQCQIYWPCPLCNTERTVCAGAVSGSGPTICAGDYGGPLACQTSTQAPFTLYGVGSFNKVGCDDTKPAVFTNIYKYRNWIAQKTNGDVPA